MPGLQCCVGFSLVAEGGGYSLVAVRGLIAVASLVAGHRLWGSRASALLACGPVLQLPGLEHSLSSCGARAWLLRGVWDLPGSGIKPVSPTLAGRFFTTEPPGKPEALFLKCHCELTNLTMLFVLIHSRP